MTSQFSPEATLASAEKHLISTLALLKTKTEKVQFLQEFRSRVANDDWEWIADVVERKAGGVVPIQEFIEGKEFLNMRGVLYPEVMREVKAMSTGEFVETVLTGAIGTGKTTIALIITAYQLYLLAQYDNPQLKFGLDPSSEIVFIFQSINAKLAKDVDYSRFKATIDNSPWFQQNFKYDKTIESELRFPHRIIVKPVSGTDTAAIGQNVIGGVIDELNFMSQVDKSKHNKDGGAYDQAIAVYNSISRRRKSRFMTQGKMPGILCLVSSVRYPGEFTDQKIAESHREIERTGKTSIYVYRKTTWEIKPHGTFTGDWFKIFIGDDSRRPRIMADNEVALPRDEPLVIEAPEEYRAEFESDIMNALRDIAGVATLAHHPYIIMTEMIAACADPKLPKIFSQPTVDFVDQKLTMYPERIPNPDWPRFAHVDLGVTGDSAGVVIGHCCGFKDIDRGDHVETLPDIQIDCVLEVAPPRNGEILFWKIRDVFHALKKHGMALRWITFDSFQSVDSIQLLRQSGFISDRQSMDKDIDAYEFTKAAIYDSRVHWPPHGKLRRELSSLEKDVKKNKIDHPPNGSKDVSDALAGVVYGLTMRREVWAMFGIKVMSIPESIKLVLNKDGKSAK
jgi:hypothetical protein